MKRLIFKLALVVIFCALLPSAAHAGGATTYPNGAEDFLSGALPPPGDYGIWYSIFYHANGFKDNSGHDYSFGPRSDIRITTWANALRWIHVSDVTLFGASTGFHLFLPTVQAEFDFGHEFNVFDDEKFGFSDLIFDPLLLGWHFKNLHIVAGVDIYVPTGRYDHETDILNLSSKVWTFEPALAFTWLPGPFDISVKLMYDFSTINNDHRIDPYEALALNQPGLAGTEASLRPGQEFHFDYNAGYNFNKCFALGVNGYFYRQMTDDRIDHNYVHNMKGRTFAIGPVAKYNYQRFSFVAKALWEMETNNRPQGQSTWLKVIYVF
ncbi:MAG: hypothetical protein C4541_13500 [Candidatus Auribacter fodinae]|jgi:hypothetical protein|uniref:Phenol degradation protein meta n=1 Tax=Candidatus Auribacter fodinae TaxID=2093366 RepID=A0A3A4QUS9_9BACT|nr:MAG: hypothetical protein C4541_13500 [Candidatus Auribacter fodinae]